MSKNNNRIELWTDCHKCSGKGKQVLDIGNGFRDSVRCRTCEETERIDYFELKREKRDEFVREASPSILEEFRVKLYNAINRTDG